LVLLYDLLEDRCTIDVIIAKFLPRVLKWQKVFLASILHDWAKGKCNKSIVEAMNGYEKQSLAGKRKIKPFLS